MRTRPAGAILSKAARIVVAQLPPLPVVDPDGKLLVILPGMEIVVTLAQVSPTEATAEADHSEVDSFPL